ncbi:MAG: YjjI family glycine radical enzyme [Erysipelotrichaceae bacterium]|nr:YjjI family glycine radical enzyme [Erysipelotrichaceae bacterium]
MSNLNYKKMVKDIEAIVNDQTKTHIQMEMALAKYAEDLLPYPKGTPNEFYRLFDNLEICDLNEGHGPYSARYILPDYAKFFKNGSEFLKIDPPRSLFEAINALLIMYHNVHSLDRFPVYVGQLDELFEPFVINEDKQKAKEMIKWFLMHIDRTLGSSFTQANIGPNETKTGNIILELLPELQISVPNMTLKYDPNITPDQFAQKALACALKCANPAFALDAFYKDKIGINYGIASCYNGLLIGGGAYTLTRMRLNRVAQHSIDEKDFFSNILPNAIDTQLKFMDAKIKSIVENRSFFKSDWLIKEGLIYRDRFMGLFGIVGLNECVDILMKKANKKAKYGPDEEANLLGVKVMDFIENSVNAHENKYCEAYDNHFVLHAQVGAADDDDTSPGARIAIGKELPLYDHLRQLGHFHHYFPSGVGDIFPFDETASKNPAAILDIFKGGFACGAKYLSTYQGDGDLIRVTGYLVKRSDIEKLKNNEAVINSSVNTALDPIENRGIFDRKVRSL